jgi:membrane-associated protein
LPLDIGPLDAGIAPLAGYALIVALVAGDGVFPTIPGETALIGGAILASDGTLSLPLVIAGGIVGGVLGDNVSFLLGSRIGAGAIPRLFRSERSRRRLRWAREQLAERGVVIVLVGRFIPAGRTATTFSCGALGMAWRRFAPADLAAATLWSLYACLAGYLGGRAFGDNTTGVLLAAIIVATVIGISAEIVRRRVQRPPGAPAGGGGDP